MITMQQMIKQQEMVSQGEIETGKVSTATPAAKVKSVKPRKKKND